VLEGLGLPVEDDEIVIRREISVAGKGRATVNGALVPVAVVRDVAGALMTIHGQHEPQGLLDPETHLDLVDHHAGLEGDRTALADTWRRLKVCRNPRCQVAFFDRSRNNSGVWHSTKVCGNVENLRAHRARAKSSA